MRKLLLLSLLALAACGNDDKDENELECENRLWELIATGDATNTTYYATYGVSEASAGTIEVDQSTYDHYTALGNPNDGSLCWVGPQ